MSPPLAPALPPPASAVIGPSRRPARRATSLLSAGEPQVWLTGGALALCVLMIAGLLTIVLLKGTATFWPGEVLQVRTASGTTLLGEVAAVESYRPEAHAFDVLPEAARPAAAAGVAAAGGDVERRLLRTGNFELTGTDFTWVSDFDRDPGVADAHPEWALVIERQTWGRFYGVPTAFLIDGQPVAEGPAAAWAEFERHHESVRERWEERSSLEKHELGELMHRQEAARLAVRRAELEHGTGSAEVRAAEAAQVRTEAELAGPLQETQGRIKALNAENARYALRLQTAAGASSDLQLADLVRAYPANRLGLPEKLGVYLSRWGEFLTDEPRETNSEGGVLPAIFGTVVMTLLMSLLVVPFGVLAALYLREYAKPGPVLSIVRIAINNLAGVPSIVFGVFGLGFFCYTLGHSIDELLFAEKLPSPTFGTGGLMWASLTLALLTLPVVIVATEEALAAVPRSMREGSYACGASKWQTIRRIVLPRAMPGIMTGMILAIARGAGEVAPLMLVGAAKLTQSLPVDGTFPFVHPERSFMHLGFHIYDVGMQSRNSEASKPLVFTTTLVLIGLVVVLNVTAIWVRSRLRRKFSAGQA